MTSVSVYQYECVRLLYCTQQLLQEDAALPNRVGPDISETQCQPTLKRVRVSLNYCCISKALPDHTTMVRETEWLHVVVRNRKNKSRASKRWHVRYVFDWRTEHFLCVCTTSTAAAAAAVRHPMRSIDAVERQRRTAVP